MLIPADVNQDSQSWTTDAEKNSRHIQDDVNLIRLDQPELAVTYWKYWKDDCSGYNHSLQVA